ncbi:MAG: PRC-barrel domain-containing protein [Candidatus Nanoarchaeia archaeon]|jgi:sporulation protein YlmC with PRC-barrel domain|nr:PRC-barrel domain-containing protein [Candidatus Nanoarchaeia archaeon]MDD3993884.1 PRC-barrel domain-containing protein [Candidatus Nanoarchaeia archaeon]MDD4563577.1 PRC-barrel domain-containing protein [Candidatus Nanoarchaeia archaeon]
MLNIKKLGDVIDKQVYIDNGEFFGKVDELTITENRIDGWRIVAKDAEIISLLAGARGIVVPQQFIKAIGDIVIISKNAIPLERREDLPVEEELL